MNIRIPTIITSVILITVVIGGIALNSLGYLLLPHERNMVISLLAESIREHYVIEEKANDMAALIIRHRKWGKYNWIFTSEQLWKAVMKDLKSVCNDEHLLFISSPDMVAYAKNRIANIDTENEADRKTSEEDNHGVKEAKMITEDIGYLQLTRFANILYVTETLVEAMKTVENASSLIIDLRYNNGGIMEMAQFLFSYFVDESDSVLMNTEYIRHKDQRNDFWSLKYIPGKRLIGCEVYILTSGYTFSAAEGFAYSMKHHKMATIVGETTKGGAHSVDWKIIGKHYVLRVPVGRIIHPVTGANWESVGVQPNIEVDCSMALNEALTSIQGKNE